MTAQHSDFMVDYEDNVHGEEMQNDDVDQYGKRSGEMNVESRDRGERRDPSGSYSNVDQYGRRRIYCKPATRMYYPGMPEHNSDSRALANCVARNVHKLDIVLSK